MYWEKFINSLDKYYYGEWLLAIVEIVVLLLIIRNKPGGFHVINALFIFYISVDLVLLLTMCFLPYTNFMTWPVYMKAQNIINTCITFIELSTYYFYFLILLGRKYLSSLVWLYSIFCIIMIIYLSTNFSFLTNRLRYVSNLISVTEFIFILPYCFIYFKKILKESSDLTVFSRPSFWIITGIFFFSLVSIPYYLMNVYFSNKAQLTRIFVFWFYFIPFIVNILFIGKAVLCKKSLTI